MSVIMIRCYHSSLTFNCRMYSENLLLWASIGKKVIFESKTVSTYWSCAGPDGVSMIGNFMMLWTMVLISAIKFEWSPTTLSRPPEGSVYSYSYKDHWIVVIFNQRHINSFFQPYCMTIDHYQCPKIKIWVTIKEIKNVSNKIETHVSFKNPNS